METTIVYWGDIGDNGKQGGNTTVLIMGTQRLVPLSWSSAGAALTPNPIRVGDYVVLQKSGQVSWQVR